METCCVSPDFNCAIVERSCHRVHLGLKLLESGSWLHGWVPAFEPSGLETARRKNNFGSNKIVLNDLNEALYTTYDYIFISMCVCKCV